MSHPYDNKTPEERAKIFQKGVATRRANKIKKEQEERERWELRDELGREIKSLKEQIAIHKKHECFAIASLSLTKKYMLNPQEILENSFPYNRFCGIYFLIKDLSIVYVGQSVDIYTRVATHSREKKFTDLAFILCEPHELDILESLYIHALQPSMNGNHLWGGKSTQFSLQQILDLAKGVKT